MTNDHDDRLTHGLAQRFDHGQKIPDRGRDVSSMPMCCQQAYANGLEDAKEEQRKRKRAKEAKYLRPDWPLPRKHGGRNMKFTDEEVEWIRSGYVLGIPAKAVARRLQCAIPTIKKRYELLKHEGVVRNPKQSV